MKFRSKPATVDAVQWDGTIERAEYIVNWVRANGGAAEMADDVTKPGDGSGFVITVETNHGVAPVHPGVWVVQGPTDFYPCDPDTFAARWEPAEDGDAR